jgi:predicted ester cyclase
MDAKSLGVRLFEECWDQGQLSVLDEILDPQHIFHVSGESIQGAAAYKAMLSAYHEALNPNFVIKHVIAEGNFAAIHYEESGVFAKDWVDGEMAHKATGNKYATFGVELIRVEDGRIVEAWPGHDSATHFTQIGILEWRVPD